MILLRSTIRGRRSKYTTNRTWEVVKGNCLFKGLRREVRKLKLLIFVVAFTVIAAGLLAVLTPASAHGPCDSDGRGYGVEHIAGHTPHGPADAYHNPGTHMGFSVCLSVHE